MFIEPQPTEYDFTFQLFGIPVRVNPWFWFVSLLMGISGGTGAQEILIWVAVVFVSILIHELGHAVVIRYFGWSPRIVLYSFGGLAIYDPSFAPWQSGRRVRRGPGQQILISLAGPGAGFVLASVVVAGLYFTNRSSWSLPLVGPLGVGDPLLGPLGLLIFHLLYVNIFWGLLNLMPIHPLDGGQVARELFLANSHDGLRQSLTLSMVTAIGLAVFAFVNGETFLAILFGYLAYSNYVQLSGPFGGGFGRIGGTRPW